MDLTNIINCSFGWVLVILAIIGYFVTYRTRGERWSFWYVLAAGWAFFATAQTLLIAGAPSGVFYVLAIWISSFVLVAFSLVLLFIKLLRTKS